MGLPQVIVINLLDTIAVATSVGAAGVSRNTRFGKGDFVGKADSIGGIKGLESSKDPSAFSKNSFEFFYDKQKIVISEQFFRQNGFYISN